MKVSILHISDLHRNLGSFVNNEALLSSLERDRDRYTLRDNPRIKSPDLIIVSGDIIQGVKFNGTDAEAMLQRQYEEALSFLNGLANSFVGGDKQRVIIVPGNHDVSNYYFRKSLAPIEIKGDKKALAAELFKKRSTLRWSWEEFSLYEIADKDVYHRRFAAFTEFYNNFYEGKYNYSIEPEKQFNVFHLPDLGVVVTGFCSCYNNDLMNQQGDICPDCIVSAESQILKSLESQECIRIAVWHHNTEGLPFEINYMNSEVVQNLIDRGFSLGFHGHQHSPEFIDKRFLYGLDRHINVISAGTLCGNPAFNHRCAYNIVELDISSKKGWLHVRETRNSNSYLPIWEACAIPPNQSRYLKFDFDPPPKPSIKVNHHTALLSKAQKLHDQKKYRDAADILHTLEDDLARHLLRSCLSNLNDVAGIIKSFDPPKNSAEAIVLLDALWKQKDKNRISEVLKLPLITKSTDPSIVEIRSKYTARLKNDRAR